MIASRCLSAVDLHDISFEYRVVNTLLGVFDIDAQDDQSDWAYSIYEWVNRWYLNRNVDTIPVRYCGVSSTLRYDGLGKALSRGTHIVLWLYMLSARHDKNGDKGSENERVLYLLAEGDIIRNTASISASGEGLSVQDNFVSVRINQTNPRDVFVVTVTEKTSPGSWYGLDQRHVHGNYDVFDSRNSDAIRRIFRKGYTGN